MDRSPAVPNRTGSRLALAAARLFRAGLRRAPTAETAAIAARVDDADGSGPTAGGGPGWTPLNAPGPHDRDYTEWLQDQQDALEAWRRNVFVRRIVAIIRSYVVGGGIEVSSGHPWVGPFVAAFAAHPQNHLADRLGPICDELTRAGEIFPVLFTNPADGMSYLRFVPATEIREVRTGPGDCEKELSYLQAVPGSIDGAEWLGRDNPAAWTVGSDGALPPLMLHYAVNRPLGATRGEGDLTPILRWALRYSSWLEDRVRLNRVRTRQQMLEIELADDTQVKQRSRQVATEDPVRAGIYVHGPGEKVATHRLEIGADDAEGDGRALRLAIATGAHLALHYLGEGESTNYATAREMGEPTARFFAERQAELCAMLLDLLCAAYRRKAALGLARPPAGGEYGLQAAVTEPARADNAGLAAAARDMVAALREMRAEGWVDDRTAVRLAFKFAGEAISPAEVEQILGGAGRW